MEKIGKKIRIERKKMGLTMHEMAKKIGISPITLHRIETGKSSPSVALLSEIAQNLNTSVVSFINEAGKPLHYIKNKDHQTISSPSLKIKLIGPRKMITNNIEVTYGELKKGKKIDIHSNPGIEWAYIIEGKCEHRQGDQKLILETGDSVSYDARQEHSVVALEKLKFFAIYLKNRVED
jgi:transcriptional regulator with XRE-family HTH domain